MNLEEALEQYHAAKSKVTSSNSNVRSARTKLTECEANLRSAATAVADCEEADVKARRHLARIAKKIGPLVASEVSGICGKLEPADDSESESGGVEA